MGSWVTNPANAAVWFGISRKQARCWRVTRTDGTIYRFTDADRVIWVGSERFLPSDETVTDQHTGGVEAVTTRREAARETNTELAGILSSGAITHDDLLAGKFDEARVDELWIDIRWPWLGHVKKRYVITKTEFQLDGAYRAELSSYAGRSMRKTRGRTFTRNCGHELFDERCNKADFGGSAPFVVNEWLLGTDTASWATVSTVHDEHSFDVLLPTGTITGITPSPTLLVSGTTWLNVVGDWWQVALTSSHGFTAGQTFDVIFSGVTGTVPDINGTTFTVVATGTGVFQVQLVGVTGTPSGGTVRIGATTITCSGGHPFGYFGATYPFTAKLAIGVRDVTGGSPTINARYAEDVNITSATTLTIPITTASAGTGGTVSFEPDAEWFKNGKLTWSRSSDDNYLEVGTVRHSGEAGTTHPVTIQIDLLTAPGKPITVGDKCSLLTGCQLRLVQDCSEKFANTKNFGGYPSMATTQRLARTPGAT